MPRFHLRHHTAYAYSTPVMLGQHQLYLRPRADHALRLDNASLTISPPAEIIWRNDAYGNSVAVATFSQPTDRLDIVSELTVQTFPRSEEQRRALLQSAEPAYAPAERRALHAFLEIDPAAHDPIAPWLQKTAAKQKPLYDTLLECAARIRAEFDYRVRFEPGVQTPRETLSTYSGTCRDFAEFLIAASRSIGCAARFVTGYVYVKDAAPGSCAPHAWAECYLPGAGWIEIDATNWLIEHGDLVPVAAAANGEELTPVSGTFSGDATSTLTVTVDIAKQAAD